MWLAFLAGLLVGALAAGLFGFMLGREFSPQAFSIQCFARHLLSKLAKDEYVSICITASHGGERDDDDDGGWDVGEITPPKRPSVPDEVWSKY